MIMTAPSLTLRSVQNEETGIDISVPRFQEEEAPLGGTSILYEISVLTCLDLFKTRLHRNEDVVQFSVYKAYREMEDLYNKLNKKYLKAGLPPLPKYATIDKYTSEEKVAALDRFMKAVANDIELCHSSIFTHFIGINSQRLPSFTVPNTSSNIDLNSEHTNEEDKAKEDKVSEDLSEVFPKVKNVLPKAANMSTQSVRTNDNSDLFEEVKLVKETEKVTEAKKKSNAAGLFDDFEDDNLFNSSLIPKSVSPPKQEKKKSDIKPKRQEPEKKTSDVPVDDSEIIIKERKLGDISLFDEQDLGDYVTKDEEALFLVSPKTNEKTKKNTLLFSSDSESAEPDSELHEDLDDLLNLNPLPISPVVMKPQSTNVPETDMKELQSQTQVDIVTDVEVKSKKEEGANETSESQPKRPVPLPRKKSLGKIDLDEQMTLTRPEVMPRKVFLTKPEVPTKPSLANQSRPVKPPPISAKPTLPNKPKIPPPKLPKPTIQRDLKDLDSINANQPQKAESKTSASSLADDLNKLDILKYIEQEQQALNSEPSLFD